MQSDFSRHVLRNGMIRRCTSGKEIKNLEFTTIVKIRTGGLRR